MHPFRKRSNKCLNPQRFVRFSFSKCCPLTKQGSSSESDIIYLLQDNTAIWRNAQVISRSKFYDIPLCWEHAEGGWHQTNASHVNCEPRNDKNVIQPANSCTSLWLRTGCVNVLGMDVGTEIWEIGCILCRSCLASFHGVKTLNRFQACLYVS